MVKKVYLQSLGFCRCRHSGYGSDGRVHRSRRHSGGTVAQLKTLPDDAHMILKGNIVRNVQGDKYEFKDATGTVELEIDRKYWNGQNVKPENTVKLVVEVDKDLLKTEYEVDAPVEVLK